MTAETFAAVHAAAFTNTRAWSAAEISGLLSSPACFAVGDHRGFALGRVIVDEAELLTIAVPPDSRRQGLGRSLLRAFETAARNRGADTVFLEVAADNPAAIGLYENVGYSTQSIRPKYYTRLDGIHVDALIMTRNLT